MKSRFKGDFVYVRLYGEEEWQKIKILSTVREMGMNYYRAIDEQGKIKFIHCEGVQEIGQNKKARLLPYKKRLRLIK